MAKIISFDATEPDYEGMAYQVCKGIAESFDTIEILCRAAGTTPSHFYRAVTTIPAVRENLLIARRIRAQRHADAALALAKPADDDWIVDTYGRYSANMGLLRRAELQAKIHMQLAARLDPDLFGDRQPAAPPPAAPVQLIFADTSQAAALYRARVAAITDGTTEDAP